MSGRMSTRAAGVGLLLLCVGCGDTPIEMTDGAPLGGDLGGDMAVSCSPKCAGLTPFCNDSHHCVGCRGDSDCMTGQLCLVAGPGAASCVPGCADDSRCGGGKCCAMRCVDPMTDPANCGGCGKA